MKNDVLRGGPDLSPSVGEPGDSVDLCRIPHEEDAHGGRSVVAGKRGAVLTKDEVTTADAEADFLSGGDPRTLRCQADEEAIVGRGPDPVRTLLLTPTGPVCC